MMQKADKIVGLLLMTPSVLLALDIWQVPQVVDVADEFTLTVDGHNVPIYRMPEPERKTPGHCPYRFAVAHLAAEGEVSVSASWEGGRTNFVGKVPFYKSIEPFGRTKPLIILASRPQKNLPAKDAPGVRWFGPGLHKPGRITLRSGETLVLEGGAWVEGAIVTEGDNIRICGNGVLSGAPWPHWGGLSPYGGNLTQIAGRNISIENVLFWASPAWTVVVWNAENVMIDSIKIVNGKTGNDDGIDVCRSRNVTIRDSFVLSGDDCITPKWWCENLLVEKCTLWCECANVFRLGYECEKPPRAFRNLVFRDVDVLHMARETRPREAYWSVSLVHVDAANDQHFENICFEDLLFHDAPVPGENFISLRTKVIKNHGTTPGYIDGITFRNCRTADGRPMNAYLSAADAEHPVAGVTFDESSPVIVTRVIEKRQ